MKIRLFLTAGVVTTSVLSLMAQPGDPGDPGGGPGGGAPVPLGGIEILVAAAIVLGIKKIWDVQHSKRLEKNLSKTSNIRKRLDSLTERNRQVIN